MEVVKKRASGSSLIDWYMPVMNGIELLNRIREDRNLRDMPVVMVTAQANRELVAEGAESDIDAYILKPLTATSLASRILKVIEKANNPPLMTYHLKRVRDEEITDFCLQNRIYEYAIELLEFISNRMATRYDVIFKLGTAYENLNQPSKALSYYHRADEVAKTDIHIKLHIAKKYIDLKQVIRVEQMLNSILKLDPKHKESQKLLRQVT